MKQLNTTILDKISNIIKFILKFDSKSQERFERLKGKRIMIELKDIEKTFFIQIGDNLENIINTEYTPDLKMKFNLKDILIIKNSDNITQLIKSGKLDIEGDMNVAQNFSNLLQKLSPDLEEILSTYLGDILGFNVHQALVLFKNKVNEIHSDNKLVMSDLMLNEIKITPHPNEVAYFCSEVDVLKMDLANLEFKFNQIKSKLNKR